MLRAHHCRLCQSDSGWCRYQSTPLPTIASDVIILTIVSLYRSFKTYNKKGRNDPKVDPAFIEASLSAVLRDSPRAPFAI